MAASQYRSGMSLGEPDVFETSDLPEVDQSPSTAELSSESVERLDVNVDEAYRRFNSKSLNAADTDFSDRVGRGPRTGYYVPRTEYELLAESDRVKETPEQKFQRLQREIRELADDLGAVKESVKSEGASDAPLAVGMTKQVEYLGKQLQELSLDKQLGESGGGITLSDPQAALHKRLLTELDAAKSTTTGSAGATPAGDGGKTNAGVSLADPDHMTFKLFYHPQQAKFSNNARVADLEQRLERLESLLGPNDEKLTTLTADISNKSLMGVVASLNTKVKLLDPTQLDNVQSKLSSIHHRLSELGEKQEKLEQSGKLSKVAELEKLMKKWDPVATSLPSVVERLTSLKDLHENALQFSQTMTRLDSAQTQLTDQLKSRGVELKEVQATFDTNKAIIMKNCESLNARIDALTKK